MLVDDLEEGEITSEEEEEGDCDGDEMSAVDYEVLPRPVKTTGPAQIPFHGEAFTSPGSSRTLGVDPVYQNVSRPTRPAPVLQHFPEENDAIYDKSSSSSDDSDDEYGPSGRKCRRMPMPSIGSCSFSTMINNNNVQEGSISALPLVVGGVSADDSPMITDPNDDFKNQASAFQQKRKPNNIWSTVLQEEEASDILGKVNVDEYDEQHVLIDRGPETFSVKYQNRPRVRQKSDSSSVSSGGLTDNELEFLRGASVDDQKESMGMEEEEDDGEGFVEQFGRRPMKRRYNTKERRQKKKRKSKVVNKLRKMDAEELGYYISTKLDEAKHNLIINAVELIGKEAVISLFLKTAKIQRHGGLMIMNQQRRRTAGGVFFYLLRGDRKFPKKIVDKIFASDIQNQRIGRKRAHKAKRCSKFAKLEEKIEELRQQNQQEEDNVPANSLEVDPDPKEGSLSGADDDDLDSDEFCGMQEPALKYPPSSEMRTVVGYEDQDCLEIHCDASDLM